MKFLQLLLILPMLYSAEIEVNSKTFLFFSKESRYDEAVHTCAANGGTLAHLTSKSEIDAVLHFIHSGAYVASILDETSGLSSILDENSELVVLTVFGQAYCKCI